MWMQLLPSRPQLWSRLRSEMQQRRAAHHIHVRQIQRAMYSSLVDLHVFYQEPIFEQHVWLYPRRNGSTNGTDDTHVRQQ